MCPLMEQFFVQHYTTPADDDVYDFLFSVMNYFTMFFQLSYTAIYSSFKFTNVNKYLFDTKNYINI